MEIGHAAVAGRMEWKMARTNPFEFLQQVRQEAAKVTWPTRRETMITTIMVMIMVVLPRYFSWSSMPVLKWVVERLLLVSF